jgi:predicted CXXCH cytochrome family protein
MNARLLVLASLLPTAALADGSIVSSKHNLSVTGPGPIKATEETRVCVFCHVGHNGGPLGVNRPESSALYRPYESTTLAAPGSLGPTGASRLCLSCHDGTIALGETLASGTIHVSGTGASGRLPEGPSNLGTNLKRTHPVSFAPVPSSTLRPLDPEGKVRLDRKGELQCTACHDPHREDLDPAQRKFLTMPNRFSGLCTTCHAPEGWQSNPGAHQASTAPLGPKEGPKFPYATVAENGCASCHRPHAAGEQGRLLRTQETEKDDELCLGCHNGFVAKTDIASQVSLPFSHGSEAMGRERVHDASEGPWSTRFQLPERRASAQRHATCVDCHEPHAAFQRDATAPRIKGANAGTWGVDLQGEAVRPARFEYELCFKCHGDSANQPLLRGSVTLGTPRRVQEDPNLRLQFAPDAPSAHPVTQPGRALDVPSLKAPFTVSSLLYCTDCHGSSAAAGRDGPAARGPHGSQYPFLLARNLSTSDRTLESEQAYALCYGCHDRQVLLSDQSSFRLHRKHVVDSATPCTGCHASHGISPLRGTPRTAAHLMDFDTQVAGRTRKGELGYESLGPRHGTCTVACHGTEHAQTAY